MEFGTVTFDRTLPRAIEEVFGTCLDPLRVSESPIDPGGVCDSIADLQTAEAQLLWLALKTQPPIDASAAFASAKDALVEVYHIDRLPFPVQNCDIFLDVNMAIQGLSFTNAEAKWIMHGQAPAFTLGLDHTQSSTQFASGTIDRNVDCPNPANELVVAGYVPKGAASVKLDDVDLDVWFDLTFSGSDVTVTTQVALEFSRMRLDPPLSQKVVDSQGTFQEIVEAQTGSTMTDLKDQANRTLAKKLSSVRDQIKKMVQDAIPTGHHICSMTVVSGKLVMTTTNGFCPIEVQATAFQAVDWPFCAAFVE